MAVRLEDVAEPGQVICTEATHRLLQGQFECASLGRRKIKGVAQPVELFRVQGVAAAAEPDRGGGAGRAHAADRPRPRDQPAQGPLGAGPGGHGPGRPARRRAGPGQVAPGVHAEGARPGADGRRGGGRARHRVALLAALPEHGAVPGHRLLRAGPRLRPRGAAAGPVRPPAPPPGAVRPGPAGGRAAVGVAAVAADPGPLPAARRCRRPGRGKRRSGPCWSGCTREPPGGRSCSSSRTCTGWTRPPWSSWGSSSPSACTTGS